MQPLKEEKKKLQRRKWMSILQWFICKANFWKALFSLKTFISSLCHKTNCKTRKVSSYHKHLLNIQRQLIHYNLKCFLSSVAVAGDWITPHMPWWLCRQAPSRQCIAPSWELYYPPPESTFVIIIVSSRSWALKSFDLSRKWKYC